MRHPTTGGREHRQPSYQKQHCFQPRVTEIITSLVPGLAPRTGPMLLKHNHHPAMLAADRDPASHAHIACDTAADCMHNSLVRRSLLGH